MSEIKYGTISETKHDKIKKHYIQIIRKIFSLVFISINLFYYGLNIEIDRSKYNWLEIRIFEIIILFILLCDLMILKFIFHKFVELKYIIFLITYVLMIILQICMKLYGPEILNASITDAVRILISLPQIMLLKNISYDYDNKIESKNFDKNIILTNINTEEIDDNKIKDKYNKIIREKFNLETQKDSILMLNKFDRVSTNLDTILSDDFDIFKFDQDCNNNTLFVLMNYYIHFYNITEIDMSKYINLIFRIQKSYKNNSYHNSLHAADVANTAYYILEKLEAGYICDFTKFEKFILLLSCSAHDMGHPGNTNSFEINSKSILAMTYNDQSVLENFHLFLFFSVLKNDNIFITFNIEEVKRIRKNIIANVLSTDITMHHNNITKLNNIISNKPIDILKQENKDFIMTQIVHCSDLSNPLKSFDIYEKWINRVFIEFHNQGDKEKELGLPISFLCDRDKIDIPNSQLFFIDNYVSEFTICLNSIFPKFEILIKQLDQNRKKWKNKLNNL